MQVCHVQTKMNETFPGLAEPSNARNLHKLVSLNGQCYRRTKLREKMGIKLLIGSSMHFGATKILQKYLKMERLYCLPCPEP